MLLLSGGGIITCYTCNIDLLVLELFVSCRIYFNMFLSDEPMVTESTKPVTQTTQVRPTNSAQGKEFDPLSSQKAVEEKVMSSFGIGSGL